MNEKNEVVDITPIYNEIRTKLLGARKQIYTTINITILETYWYIGKTIIELQEGDSRAEYGKAIVKSLSQKLTKEFGNGFSIANLTRMKNFYEYFPNIATLSQQLSWSHYVELVKIHRKEERDFYYNESVESNWSVRELQRQKNAMLYNRLLLGADINKVKELSEKGIIINKPEDVVKNPYVFEFLGLKENTGYLESDLEKALLNHLTEFLLELGKGFSFMGNQVRITLDGDHFYPDLIFYNRLAKCFVIIDLKIGKLTHQDVGQMQMYVNYYKRTQMIDGENEPIGILLCADKNDTVVEMTLGDEHKNIYASNYLTYLPTKEELIREIETEKAILEAMEERENDNNE